MALLTPQKATSGPVKEMKSVISRPAYARARTPFPHLDRMDEQNDIYEGIGCEVDGRFLGPTPVCDFLACLPGSPIQGPSVKSPFHLNTYASKRSAHEGFITAVSSLVPSLRMQDTHTSRDNFSALSPGVSCYRHESTSPQRVDFVEMELFGDLFFNGDDDPFIDAGCEAEHLFETDNGFVLRGRMASCAAAILGSQFRTHVFSFALFGSYARLFRWDASGILVTERFLYAQSNALYDFLWRFNNAPLPARGHDDSVVRMNRQWPTDVAPVDVLHRLQQDDPSRGSLSPKFSRHNRHRFFGLMKIPNRLDPSIETNFLVSCPSAHQPGCRSPLGRSTRPLLAYDIANRRMVFVKQYWRLIESGPSTKEGEIYLALEREDVQHLPAFNQGNDVRGIATQTQRFQGHHCRRRAGTAPLSEYRLYRMSLSSIGVPLTEFRTTEELVRAITDAMICHDEAFFRAKILHGDISIGNIMINSQTRRGMLIDWDLSSPVKESEKPTHDSGRKGTWQFMSVALLRNPENSPSILDDRESFLYVLVQIALLYLPHNSIKKLPEFLELFDEVRRRSDSSPVGGAGKYCFLLDSNFSDTISFKNGQTVSKIITTLQRHFIHRYLHFGRTSDAQAEYLDLLAKEGSLVRILQNALESGPWSPSDTSAPNRIPKRAQKRRITEVDCGEPEGPASKSRKLSHDDYIATRSLPDDLTRLSAYPVESRLAGYARRALQKKRKIHNVYVGNA